jgi:hypothetical protein
MVVSLLSCCICSLLIFGRGVGHHRLRYAYSVASLSVLTSVCRFASHRYNASIRILTQWWPFNICAQMDNY